MAQWVSANLAMLLPPGTQTILDTIDSLLSVVKAPLDLMVTILDTAKNLVLAFSLFDFIPELRGLIEDFKAKILGSGFFVCPMWDYPVRQLTRAVNSPNYVGPDDTFGMIDKSGHEFKTSFLKDLLSSFDDERDPNRPQFTGPCAMLVLVRAARTPEQLGISSGEDNLGDAWGGLGSALGEASKAVRTIRFRAALAMIKEAAQHQSKDYVQGRVERAERAIQLLSFMSDDELDAVPYPENEETGGMFFDDIEDPSELDWSADCVPVLESLEAQYQPSAYPDWSRITLRDINPNLVSLVDYVFDPIIDLLQSGITLKQKLIDLIDAIKSKIEYLQSIIDSIQVIIDEIERLLNATGFHALYVTSSIGTVDLRIQAVDAEGPSIEGPFFYAGMTLLAGSDAKVIFDTLFAAVGS